VSWLPVCLREHAGLTGETARNSRTFWNNKKKKLWWLTLNIGSVRLLLHDVTSCVLWVCVCQLEDSGALDRVLLYCQATAGRLMMELRTVTNDDLYIKTSGFCKP